MYNKCNNRVIVLSMRRFLAAFAALAFAAFASAETLPTPQQYFGFRIGSDRKIVRYDKMIEYFQKMAASSDRVMYRNLGPTTGGNPFVMLEIAAPATLRNLDHYKTLERKLYFQGGAPEAEREQIFREGKAVVLITNNIHSTEIGSSQMAIELAYRLATEDSPAVRKILDQVIVLLAPSVNPDGQIKVTDWYNKYLGTPQEGESAPPWLYHTYAGHDDNRDMFLLSLKETQMVAQVLWHEWFPSIWLDQHQQGVSGPRMFTMPASDPINPNVHPLIYRLNTIFGQIQAAALEAAGKDGIMHGSTYTSFWQGAMAWAGWWHNQVGLLTEAASVADRHAGVHQGARRLQPERPLFRGCSAAWRSWSLLAPSEMDSSRSRRPHSRSVAPRDVTPRADLSAALAGWAVEPARHRGLRDDLGDGAAGIGAADSRETLLRQIYDVNSSTIEARDPQGPARVWRS